MGDMPSSIEMEFMSLTELQRLIAKLDGVIDAKKEAWNDISEDAIEWANTFVEKYEDYEDRDVNEDFLHMRVKLSECTTLARDLFLQYTTMVLARVFEKKKLLEE